MTTVLRNSPKAFRNFLLSKYEMYSGKIKVNSRPYLLIMDPADRCQLRCPGCPTGIENEARRSGKKKKLVLRANRAIMSEAVFDSIFEELGDYLFTILFYNYGEPLLNKNLHKFIRKAVDSGIVTEVHTNLSLPLSDQRIQEILESGLHQFVASVDGFTQETYERYRVGGNLDMVKNNIERMVSARDRLGLNTHIVYKTLVFSFNEHELPEIQKYCNDLGITFLPSEAFVHDPSWLPSYRQIDQSAKRKSAATRKKEYSPPPWVEAKSNYPQSCAWHYGFSVITAAGSVSPCCSISGQLNDHGDIVPGETGFKDIWTGPNVTLARRAQQDKKIKKSKIRICTQCPYPNPIRHLYSVNDEYILRKYYQEFGSKEEHRSDMITTAYELLCLARFGSTMEYVFGEGRAVPPDHQQDIIIDQARTDRFIRYMELAFANQHEEV